MHGAVQPFGLVLDYQGGESFPEYQSFVLENGNHAAISLEPLGFWEACPRHSSADERHFFFYDSPRAGGFEFKAAGYDCTLNTSERPEYSVLATALQNWRSSDPTVKKIKIDELRQTGD